MTKRNALCNISLIVPLGLFWLQSGQEEATPAQQPVLTEENPIEQMDWMAGTWKGPMWGGVFEAHYGTPTDGRVLGHSRLWRDEKESYFEFEVFEVRDGVAHVQPYPGGKRATGLRLTEHTETKAVFENPDKDYPTRMVYERVGADRLTITLTDPHGGTPKRESFELTLE